MLCLILIVGGLLIMMGQHDRSEALFYYFRLEDQVPETHLLRLIEKHISFAFVRERLKESYSDTGRPSIDPELLHHERAQVGRGTAHASGLALVYRPRVRSGDSAPLHVLEESSRSFSGNETVRTVV